MNYIVTSENITVYDEQGNKTIATKGTPEFKEAFFLIQNDSSAEEIRKKIIETIMNSGYEIEGETLKSDGKVVPSEIAKEIKQVAKSNDEIPKEYKLFLNKLDALENKVTAQRIKDWVSNHGLCISEKGNIVSLKATRTDGYSHRGNTSITPLRGKVDTEGRIKYIVGQYVELDLKDCDPDVDATCSNGLHCGAIDYLNGYTYGDDQSTWYYVEVDPKNIIVIPEDCNSTKIRCSKMKVLKKISDKETAELRGVVKSKNVEIVVQIENKREEVNENETLEDNPLITKIKAQVEDKEREVRAITKNLKIKGLTAESVVIAAMASNKLEVVGNDLPNSKKIIKLIK